MSNQNTPRIDFKSTAYEKVRFKQVVSRRNKSSNDEDLKLIEFNNLVSGIGYLKTSVEKNNEKKKGLLFEQNDILFGKLRPYLENWHLAKHRGIAFGEFWVFETRNNYDSTYVYYLIQTPKFKFISNISTGTRMPRSDWNIVSKASFYLSTDKEEQIKIGNFLKELDELIELQQRKINNLKEMKKGFLQRLFLLTDELYPKIRFKGYHDKWLQTELSSIVEDLSENDGRTDLPILTISAARGWLTQQERFSQIIAGSELKKYTLLKRGELSYNKGNSKTAEFGVVYRLNNFDAALVPRVYHSFKPINKSNSYFIEKLFESKKPDKELRKIITSGARRDGLLNINKKNFYGINIVVPSPDEQKKIGDFFKQLDKLIELEEQELESLQEMKKGFLQKMFV